ncbi:MAG: glycosyltransferase [Prevotellaceae bacterium]|jgi:glycosyltransferase involved in cell wall biosynthesis|nr:glycosyltransferase [Prevotellaceae bacterium]
MEKTPLVSVNIPVKNGKKYLKQCIESVLNQTFSDFELLIVNDGSTDETANIVRSFSDKRIRFFENETCKGIAFTRNFAVELSRGKYIAVFDCDDVMLPEKLQKQVDFLKKNPDFALVGSSIEKIDKKGVVIGKQIYKLPENLIKSQLFFDNYFAQPSMLIRREVFEKFRYNPQFMMASDYAFWSQIAENHKVANLKEILIKYRIHSQSITLSQLERQQIYIKKIFEFQLSLLKIFPTENELENHFLLLKNPAKIDVNSTQFAEILQWSELLKSRNKELQIFDNQFFNKYLKRLFRKIYRENLKNERNFFKKIKLWLKTVIQYF